MFKFAIIGCGQSAALHAKQISRIGKLVAVCDVISEKADDLAAEYKAKAYYSADDLFDNESGIDIVCVCTPNGCHAEHCIKSLQAGFHVLCEGPLCLTTAAAWQMIETEKFCRKKLMVVNTIPHNPAAVQLKKEIDKATEGKTFNFDLNCSASTEPAGNWRNKVFPGGGALYTHFSHYINLLLYLFGEIEDVKGYSANQEHMHLIETEDTGEAVLDMKNGILGEIHWKLNTSSSRNNERLVISNLENPITVTGNRLDEIIEAGEISYSLLYDNMVSSLKESKPVSGLYQSLKTVETIEKIYRAVSLNLSSVN